MLIKIQSKADDDFEKRDIRARRKNTIGHKFNLQVQKTHKD